MVRIEGVVRGRAHQHALLFLAGCWLYTRIDLIEIGCGES
jgi:hypothetical protein